MKSWFVSIGFNGGECHQETITTNKKPGQILHEVTNNFDQSKIISIIICSQIKKEEN